MLAKQLRPPVLSKFAFPCHFRRLCGNAKPGNFFDGVGRNWETAWKQNVTPWETGKVTEPLKHAIERGVMMAESKLLCQQDSYALVPGCGSGRDCMFLASAPARPKGKPYFENVVGLDLSPDAVALCEKNYQSFMNQRDGNTPCGDVTFTAANFFDYKHTTPDGSIVSFDFIFDYLFFAALDHGRTPPPPANQETMREQWARSMQRLLKPNTGLLATLMFPTVWNDRPTDDQLNTGPPYHVTLDSYREVLGPLGFQCVHYEHERHSIKPRQGREIIAYWRLRHKAADRISRT